MNTDHRDLRAKPLRCSEVIDLVTHLLDDALSDHDRELVDAHLASCEGCRVYVAQMRTTITLTARLGTTERRRSSEIRIDEVLLQKLADRCQQPT